ncbi:hypothetical protein D7Y13_00265 [Corallococcus praedator]|uniref:Uncharacterized protein n=1 Tax=Corallococcus praedator TaxID=2316724 RepID=A0ABX9QSD7_9BACT|nr:MULTISPECIES: hypothetical protein [Corallococcus]RKH36532.1 hypothetical protein D7X75_00475 [Corallococcus sp. CA031C]RKI17756.1 hypothetical protein D7Y13_00265 [Corallococcus praedator]
MNPFRLRMGPGTALAALLATGCGQPPPSPPAQAPLATQRQHNSTYVPMFCAYSPGALAECAPSPASPQVVYDRVANRLANTCGSDLACRYQVIKLWSVGPGEDSSAGDLTAWMDSQQQVTNFLKNNNKSADALLESLKIHAGESRNYVKDQGRILAAVTERVKTMLGAAEAKVKQEASAYGDPVVLEEADVKAGMEHLEETVARARATLDTLAPQVVTLANRFSAYKATEAATTAKLHALASQGSAADLQGLVTVQLDAVDLAHQESAESSAIAMEAVRLRVLLAELQEDYVEQLAPHKDFIARRGLRMGDLVDGELEMLGGIEGYAGSRLRKVLTGVDTLLEGMKQRRDALIGLEANAATRQALADAAFLTASQRFLDDVTSRSTKLWQVAPRSTVLKLSLLAEKFDQMDAYLQFEPACAPPQAGQRSWREAGCVAMRRDFSRVRSWMTSTLPGTLRINVAMMRQAGTVPAALLTDVEAKLATGQLKTAAMVHDAALRVSDGL